MSKKVGQASRRFFLFNSPTGETPVNESFTRERPLGDSDAKRRPKPLKALFSA